MTNKLTALITLAASSLYAGGFYLQPEAGAIFNSQASCLYPTKYGMMPATLKTQTGYYVGAEGGYSLSRRWSIDEDVEYDSEQVKSLVINGVGDKTPKNRDASGWAEFTSVIYHLPAYGKLQPYVGVGRGYQAMDSATMRYQGKLGLQYNFTKDCALSLDYKTRWGGNFESDGLQIKAPSSKLIGVSFRYRF